LIAEVESLSIWKLEPSPAQINEMLEDTMARILGIEFLEAGDDYIKASMPLNNKTRQYMGHIHGGANVVLAETLANVACNHCCDENKTVVGLEINANHLRPGLGTVTAITRPIHIGRTTMVWEVKITDENNKLTCISRFTGAVIDKPAS
tara:strand:- start:31146 stop:31592 length:447 start_codon:yes stop_codon:yes gene_type:complete